MRTSRALAILVCCSSLALFGGCSDASETEPSGATPGAGGAGAGGAGSGGAAGGSGGAPGGNGGSSSGAGGSGNGGATGGVGGGIAGAAGTAGTAGTAGSGAGAGGATGGTSAAGGAGGATAGAGGSGPAGGAAGSGVAGSGAGGSGVAGSGAGGSGVAGSGVGGSGVAGAPPSGEAVYPDSLRCLPGNQDPRCGPGYDPAKPMDEATFATALAEGQAVWYAPGKGGGCVNCHSPDGIEFAWVGYSDCDLKRRSLSHVTEEQADKLVAYTHALRQLHKIESPLHPDRYRPFQPAYEPLGEVETDLDVVDTKKQDDRDLLFMNQLIQDKKLIFATQTIDSLEKAHAAYDELLGMDLEGLKVGIPFDRLSEDPDAANNACSSVTGPAHLGKSVFEWFPAIPVAPKPGAEGAWNALRDAYVKAPTTENLWAYYDKIDDLLRCDYDLSKDGDPLYYDRACTWMKLKYKSLQVVQHMLRHQTVRHPDTLAEFHAPGTPAPFAGDHLDLVIHRSPVWETGDFIRRNPLARQGNPACFSSPAHPCTFLPPAIDETIHSLPSYDEARINQGDLFRLSWVMMGFLREPTLTQHSDQFATFIGDYLESVLLPRYDVHHAFVFAQMAVRKSAASGWLGAPGFRKGTGKLASVRTFSFKQIRNNFSHPPQNSPRYATHRLLFANFARMFLYLVEEDLRVSGEVFGLLGRSNQEGGLLVATRFMRTWIAELEGKEDPAINALQLSIEDLGPKAKELRDEANMKDYNGLEPTYVWSDFQAPYGG